jgi:putative ABC transport system ATP-binding protein
MNSPAVSFEKVTKSYTLPDASELVLYDNLDFTIPQWTFASLMWSSGSGKSTLLNLMAWLVVPNSGSIKILWQEITALSDEQKTRLRWENIGFIFQSFNLLPYLTVAQNIDLVLDLNKLERRFATAEIATLVWLGNKLDRYPTQLSGGEQQRVWIARALVGNTTLILADEPTGNLDKKTSQQIMDLLLDLHARIGCTIVLITHDPQIAAQTQLQLRLEEGRVVE